MVEVEAVVALIPITPPAEILIASTSDAEPIVPASGITILVPKVAVVAVIANSSVPPMLIFTPVSAWTFMYPSASELIWIAESLNWSCIPSFNNKPVSATWVRFTSLSAPKFKIALSLISDKLSPTNKSSAIPAPPATVNAPVVAEDDGVVEVISITPAAEILIASVSETLPIDPASGIIIDPLAPFNVKTPVELRDIFSAAASEAAVLKDSLVALLAAPKSPSDTASIPAATKIASVPSPSSGAWKLIVPKISPASMLVSPVCNVNTNGVSSPVEVFFKVKPESATCVIVTSLSAPKFKIAPSLIRDKSSPTNKSPAIPAPPPTVKAPVVVEVEAVVALIPITPPAEILIASASDTEPIVPASGITTLFENVDVALVIDNLSVPPILRFTPVSASALKYPSASELIWIDESLNWSCIAAFSNKPVSAAWVRVTSLSAPKPKTALSIFKFKLSLTITPWVALPLVNVIPPATEFKCIAFAASPAPLVTVIFSEDAVPEGVKVIPVDAVLPILIVWPSSILWPKLIVPALVIFKAWSAPELLSKESSPKLII